MGRFGVLLLSPCRSVLQLSKIQKFKYVETFPLIV